MPKHETLAAMWAEFERTVLPADAPPERRVFARLAFYAGLAFMLEAVRELGEPDVSEDAGAARLEALYQELTHFTIDAGVAWLEVKPVRKP